jgi:hypothetical protein
MEMSALMRTLRNTSIPFTIVPYGAEAGMFLNADPAPFVNRFGIRDFVLQVGRIEPAKNQAMLCYAMCDIDVPLVLIGHPADRAYAEICRRLLPKRSLMIEHVPQEQLASAYAAARVHALPSWVETCGLVSLEASLADCSLVLSSAGYECEYFGDAGYYCDPGDSESITAAVAKAHPTKKWLIGGGLSGRESCRPTRGSEPERMLSRPISEQCFGQPNDTGNRRWHSLASATCICFFSPLTSIRFVCAVAASRRRWTNGVAKACCRSFVVAYLFLAAIQPSRPVCRCARCSNVLGLGHIPSAIPSSPI